MENVGSKMTMAPVYLTAWTCYCERIPKYLLNTELKNANANHMATLFLFVFLLFAFFYDNVIAIRCIQNRPSNYLFEKRIKTSLLSRLFCRVVMWNREGDLLVTLSACHLYGNFVKKFSDKQQRE